MGSEGVVGDVNGDKFVDYRDFIMNRDSIFSGNLRETDV